MKPFSRRTHSIIRDGGRAAGILIAATLVGLLFSGLKIPEANIIAVYILGVLIISIITSSWMYSFLASVISVLAFNFLFTIPRFTLRAYDPSYPVTFGIMFLVALITGSLASRMKEYARESAQAAMQIEKEQLRADLLRSISHDLRTPLTSISGNASNLLSNENEFSQETRMQIYGDIYDDSMWLIKLVENLLSVTRIEDGRMDLRMSAELMDEVIAEAMRHTDRNRDGRKIEVSSDEEFILGKMDARLIVQVVINPVDNAVKYTPEGAQIRIHTGKKDGMVVVSVSDTGPGIPDEQKSKVFDMFYTGTNRAADGRRSLGLGLGLCRSIIRAHGGEIWVSDNKPQGAVFTFTLPAEEVTLHE
jgi:K+-sensing histidine kinase KdpD